MYHNNMTSLFYVKQRKGQCRTRYVKWKCQYLCFDILNKSWTELPSIVIELRGFAHIVLSIYLQQLLKGRK